MSKPYLTTTEGIFFILKKRSKQRDAGIKERFIHRLRMSKSQPPPPPLHTAESGWMGLTNNWLSKTVPSLVEASTPTLKVRSTPILAFTWTPVFLFATPQTPALFARALRSAVTSGNFNLRAASKAGRPMTSNVRATVGWEKAVIEAFATALSLKGICWMVGAQPVNWVLLGLIRSALIMASLLIYGIYVRKKPTIGIESGSVLLLRELRS